MFRAIALLVVGTVVFACILTPPLYSLLSILFDSSPWPYSRVFDRVAMLCAAVFIYLLRSEFHLARLRTYFVEGQANSRVKAVVAGSVVSLGTAFVILPLIVGAGEIVWNKDMPDLFPYRTIKVLAAAVIISLIEESFFRVLVFEKLKEKCMLPLAAVICSLFYASVHFIAPFKSYVYPGFSPLVGFEYLGAVLERMLAIEIFPAFFGLFLVGLTLCYVIQRTGSVYLCIGLHMGWVMAMKFAHYTTQAVEGVVFPAGVGRRYFLVAEPLAWGSIVAVWVVMLVCATYFTVEKNVNTEA
ncbi:CPBP family intramembrane metalloprotease [Oligoflexia bacterium]|nr:CPBP family intramembrane metalloprotease [Oligoflexia bacterium]